MARKRIVKNMTLQEQANEKTVGLVCRSTRMSASTFMRLCEKYLRHRRMVVRDKKISKRYDPARQKINQAKRIKVKELVKEGAGVSSVEIKDEKIRQFEKLARRNGVRYAIKKDKSTTPPTYIVFFKAKDGEMIDRTMKEFLKRSISKDDKAKEPVIHAKLKKFKAVAMEAAAKVSKIRHKTQERGEEVIQQ